MDWLLLLSGTFIAWTCLTMLGGERQRRLEALRARQEAEQTPIEPPSGPAAA